MPTSDFNEILLNDTSLQLFIGQLNIAIQSIGGDYAPREAIYQKPDLVQSPKSTSAVPTKKTPANQSAMGIPRVDNNDIVVVDTIVITATDEASAPVITIAESNQVDVPFVK
jgi:hypothetical protein